MNFHETVMGHKFFEHDVPELINAIKENTKAINNSTAKGNMGGTVYGIVINKKNVAEVITFTSIKEALTNSYTVCNDADNAIEMAEYLNKEILNG